jgi:Flp pilus assembly protein TadG
MTMCARVRRDDGSLALETVLLAPAMMAFVALVVFGARVSLAQQAVQVAANDAARSASIERTQAAAIASSSRSASATLTTQGLECRSVDVAVDASGFNVELGQGASVTSSVTCVVSMGSLSMMGIPGEITITRTASSPIDSYRER